MVKDLLTQVHLRPVTGDNLWECLRLQIAAGQTDYVATNAQSLAQAGLNAALIPLAVYDIAARGFENAPVPIVGFTMYELEAGVGFILRLMIDKQFQGKGYGKAAMREVIRRLRLHPEVEMIATSYRRGNEAAAHLYASLGFVPWDISFAQNDGAEIFVCLAE